MNFSEYYDMVTEAKQPSFKQYVKDIYDDLKSIKTYRFSRGINFTSLKNQEAEFEIEYNKEKYQVSSDEHNELLNQFKQWHKTIALILDVKTTATLERENNNFVYNYPEYTLKNGYKISYKATYNPANGIFEINVKYIGKPVKANNVEYDTYPNVKEGTIFVCIWGYSMVIVDYYQVVKRTGKSVYLRKLNAKKQGDIRGTITPIKDSFYDNEVFRSIISGEEKNPHVKIKNKGYAHLWDGKPDHYDESD